MDSPCHITQNTASHIIKELGKALIDRFNARFILSF